MAEMIVEREVAAARERSASLLADGCMVGTRQPSATAFYIAASEIVDALSVEEVVDLIKQGLDAAHVEAEIGQLREIALQVLLAVGRTAA